MVRTVDYGARKRAILAATINRYINQPIPVASEDITEDFSLSSATIRNIFAELEEEGFLTHPYTSAGRTPTDKGYRYYVDSLLSEMPVRQRGKEFLEEDKQHIVNEYKREIRRLEDVLEKTSEVVSVVTHYASMVSFLQWQDKIFYKGISFILEQPEFQDLKRMQFVIKMIEDKEKILGIINRDFNGKVKVYIGDELGCPEMDNCSLVVSNYAIKSRPAGRLAILGPKRMEYGRIIPTLEYVSDILTDVLDEI